MNVPTVIWLFVAVFLLYRSYRRYRRARAYRNVLIASGKNGVLRIAANGNVRRAWYGLDVAVVAIIITVVALVLPASDLRAFILSGGVIAILGLFTLSGVRDDRDTNRLLSYGLDDSGQELARQDTLVEVQSDIAAVSEKVGVAADAAADAREEANKVNVKIAALTARADVSEHRADDAEAREHE